jgi:hypothetical protein
VPTGAKTEKDADKNVTKNKLDYRSRGEERQTKQTAIQRIPQRFRQDGMPAPDSKKAAHHERPPMLLVENYP